MAIIPTTQKDPTIERMKEVCYMTFDDIKSLSMGRLYECNRRTAYQFRRAKKQYFPDIFLNTVLPLIAKIPGITFINKDPESENPIVVYDNSRHVMGHVHGIVLGLIQAPKTWHVLETMVVSELQYQSLKMMIDVHGEKEALFHWDYVAFKKAQQFMHHTQLIRHYLVVATECGRDFISARTEYQIDKALKYVHESGRIALLNQLPERTEEKSLCGSCPFKGNCHYSELADRDCRNCTHASAIQNGEWFCGRWRKVLTELTACPTHRFHPDFVPGEAIEKGENFTKYKLRNGGEFLDHEH